MENKPQKEQTAMVARSLVSPCNNKALVRVLNTTGETIVLHKGTKIAELEEINESCISSIEPGGSKSRCPATPSHLVSDEKREVLWKVVEESQGDLTKEKEKFFELLVDYSDIFSTSKADLGWTSKLQHSFNTEESPPIRQPVRCLPPQTGGAYPLTGNEGSGRDTAFKQPLGCPNCTGLEEGWQHQVLH